MTALDIGGVLSIRCPTCGEERGNECRTIPGKARGNAQRADHGFHVTKPHAARVKAAPPIVEAHVGDLVLVRYRGEHVVQLVDIGDPGRAALTVRFWRPSAQAFASPRLLEREAVIGLAPDDARTAMAREELRLVETRARVVRDIEAAQPCPTFALAPDIAEGRGPFDPGQDTSDPSPTTPDAPPDPCFTSDSAPTKARKDW